MNRAIILTAVAFSFLEVGATEQDTARPRLRDLGITVGIFQPGANNAITDVAGVRVGHTTLV
ncbi:MAG: hypothetical protein JSU63_00005, partial [Phycisphaerales bacterium]